MWRAKGILRAVGLAAVSLVVVAPAQARPKDGPVAVDLSHEIEAGGPVRVDCAYGRIRIVAGTAGVVRVRGEVDGSLRGVKLWREAGAIELRLRFPLVRSLRNLWEGEPRYRVDLEVEVPADTRLFVVSKDAELTIEGITGPIGVGAVSSEVRIAGDPARLDVETVTGSVTFAGSTGSLRASTMSGAVEASGIGDRARIETVSGAITVTGSELSSGSLRTVSGDVTFAGVVKAEGTLTIDSESGGVDMRCCGTGGAEFDLVSRHGEIVNEVGEPGERVSPIRGSQGRRRLAMAVGKAGGLVEVRTGSGLIRVRDGVGDEEPDLGYP